MLLIIQYHIDNIVKMIKIIKIFIFSYSKLLLEMLLMIIYELMIFLIYSKYFYILMT